jgi:NAD(P)-dependent dehydrogenase (short-subunit alcohol dehydrogenase family)
MLSNLQCSSLYPSGTGVTTYSLHPGAVDTELQRHVDDTYFRGASFIKTAFAKLFFKTPEEGAQTTIYCSVDEKLANQTGLYYRLEFVAESMLCTLTSSLICLFGSFLS